jgi:hypothetical protein
MRKSTLVIGIGLSLAVVCALALWFLDFSVWPFGDKKVNCCTNKMLRNAQCTAMSSEECEKALGQEVEKCEDCMASGTEGNGRPGGVAPGRWREAPL